MKSDQFCKQLTTNVGLCVIFMGSVSRCGENVLMELSILIPAWAPSTGQLSGALCLHLSPPVNMMLVTHVYPSRWLRTLPVPAVRNVHAASFQIAQKLSEGALHTGLDVRWRLAR